MTSATTPPDDDLPRDPAFDDAWRALSTEEPPAAIDAALRAAARREVDAGPRIAVADRIATPRATKPMNWWRPLAVAATLGAIAVGLVQLIAPERIGAPGRDAAVVSDMPPSQIAAEPAKKQSAATAADAPAAADGQTRMLQTPAAPTPHSTDRKDAPGPASEPPASAGGSARKELQSRDAVSAFPQASPADERARQDAAAERKRDANVNVAPATSATNVEAPPSAPPASAVAPMRAAEPFPAERGKRSDATAKREAAEEPVARAPTAAGVVSPSPAEGASDKPVAPKPAPENRNAPLAKLKAAPTQDGNEHGAAATGSASFPREQDAQARAPGAAALQAATPAAKVDALGGAHPALAVPDWIALIRRLIKEGNFAAADKELAAFRAAHPDAQQLLPSDLRDWKPPH